VLGITGGIGSGKTTAADLYEALGAVVIRLDDLAKRLTAADGPLSDAVVAEFGQGVAAADGGVDAAKLADAAFASPESAARLDRIVHPGVYAAVAGALDALLELPEAPPVVVIDIPLLAESPMFFDLLDAVLAISASEDARLQRLVERGMGEEDARRRMQLQASDSERREIADYVIENDGNKVEFESELVRLWDEELAARGV
jgi:dephospho-CoA kinase